MWWLKKWLKQQRGEGLWWNSKWAKCLPLLWKLSHGLGIWEESGEFEFWGSVPFFSEDKIRLHLTWIESKTRNLRWKVLITTICSKFIQSGFQRPLFLRFQWNCWSSPNTTVTDDPGTGERKKVRETFYRRFQRVKEAEEDTMLCWNIQRKRLLTQVKAPRELIFVFIRHRRESTEQNQNERGPIGFEGRLSISLKI